MLAALLLGVFQADLQHAVVLALFIPVVLTVSRGGEHAVGEPGRLQALHGQRPRIRSILRKARWEAVTGAFLGVALRPTGGRHGAELWLGPSRVAFILFGSIVGSVACATVIGVLVPNLLRLLRQDPRVAAGPSAARLGRHGHAVGLFQPGPLAAVTYQRSNTARQSAGSVTATKASRTCSEAGCSRAYLMPNFRITRHARRGP